MSPEAETGDGVSPDDRSEREKKPAGPTKKRKGHGRNGADAYRGAEKVRVAHQTLQPGDPCPDCQQGTVYATPPPGVLVRITGQAPVQAKVYQLQKLRCNLCGKVFTAPPPEGVGTDKYDATEASMNISEQALKRAILHRKNSLFYKTTNGAHVGDVFMSLIYTCELCGTNPFDYLTELERHADKLASNPHRWMPWSYRQTLDALTMPLAATR